MREGWRKAEAGALGSPKELTDRMLAKQLCMAGPDRCAWCESQCAYGREYIRRRERRNGATIRMIIKAAKEQKEMLDGLIELCQKALEETDE